MVKSYKVYIYNFKNSFPENFFSYFFDYKIHNIFNLFKFPILLFLIYHLDILYGKSRNVELFYAFYFFYSFLGKNLRFFLCSLLIWKKTLLKIMLAKV